MKEFPLLSIHLIFFRLLKRHCNAEGRYKNDAGVRENGSGRIIVQFSLLPFMKRNDKDSSKSLRRSIRLIHTLLNKYPAFFPHPGNGKKIVFSRVFRTNDAFYQNQSITRIFRCGLQARRFSFVLDFYGIAAGFDDNFEPLFYS